MSDTTRPDPATVDTLAPVEALIRLIWRDGFIAWDEAAATVALLTLHAPTVAAALAATPHGRQAMLTALGLDQPRHCRNCGWDVSVHP